MSLILYLIIAIFSKYISFLYKYHHTKWKYLNYINIPFYILNYSDNDGSLLIYSHNNYDYFHNDIYKCSKIKIANSRFINNKGLFFIRYSNLIVDNCNLINKFITYINSVNILIMINEFIKLYIIFKVISQIWKLILTMEWVELFSLLCLVMII